MEEYIDMHWVRSVGMTDVHPDFRTPNLPEAVRHLNGKVAFRGCVD